MHVEAWAAMRKAGAKRDCCKCSFVVRTLCGWPYAGQQRDKMTMELLLLRYDVALDTAEMTDELEKVGGKSRMLSVNGK